MSNYISIKTQETQTMVASLCDDNIVSRPSKSQFELLLILFIAPEEQNINNKILVV